MGTIIKAGALYAPTVKETPNDADIESHRLLLRAGMIRKSASGIYTFLPLGYRVLKKIENIIREEMDALGAQEIMMPALQSAEIWHESGRWNDYGPELMRLTDRHDHEFCLGPTHEELITSLIKDELNSYKQLPTTLYQVQVKFRDEIRPRFGLLRSREFIMKDAYSFHDSQESLQQTYDEMSEAYGRICERCGLEWRGVEADSGQIGGKVTTEFMALASTGEAELVHCDCGYAANTEAGDCIAHPTMLECEKMEKFETPGVHTIEELANFLGVPESSTVKALSGKGEDGSIYVLFVPGDHEVNEVKAAKAVPGFEILTDEEMEAINLPKGSMGCVGLPEGVKIVADNSLKNINQWVVGANEDGYHIKGARLGVDFQVYEWADLCVVKPGDSCPNCGKVLSGDRGIEVSQVFQLGKKYSESMNAKYLDENGKQQPFLMGCYGVGVTRTLAAIVEQHNDENGIIWPVSVCPLHVSIIAIGDDSQVLEVANSIAEEAKALNLDVVLDDRKERPGVKFADSDLIGYPICIVVGKRGLENGAVELKIRATGERSNVSVSEAVQRIVNAIQEL
jgi:prolyl-tRNA synthetase